MSSLTMSSLAFRGTSSSTFSTLTHDVFLSFMYAETRRNFIATLYDALDRKGIKTYIDDERENYISPSLFKAIEESRILIVVFSQNYASSSRCLDELLKIVECKETKGQIILPVFYKVDPSDIRRQAVWFGNAFAKHGQRFKDDQRKVEKWRTALTLVADIPGVCYENNSNEAQVIDELLRKIALLTDFQVTKHPVKHIVEHPDGIESLVQEPHLSSFPQVGIESHVQEPHLSSSSSPVGIESLVQEPLLSNSPSPVGIESPVQELHLSNSPSPLGIESLVQEPLLPRLPSGNGEQGSNSSTASQGVILILIALVTGLLQLSNLFETHPVNMWIATAASFMCSLSHAAMTKINGTHWARYSQIIDIFRILSGTLVLVSLASIHLPHQLRWLFFVIWAPLAFIIVAGTWIYSRGEGRGVETTISLPQV